MIATTNMHGMVGVVMPHGVLFRGAAEGEIREGDLAGRPGRGGDRAAAEPVLRHGHSGGDPGA